MIHLPPSIKEGDGIGVLSPSNPGASKYSERFRFALEALQSFFNVEIFFPNGFEHQGSYTAGSPRQRADAFLELLTNPSVKAIFTTYGGWNSSDILSLLPREVVRAHAKVLVGYSDTTALLLGYQALADVVTYYGPALLPQFGEFPAPFEYTLSSLRKALVLGEGGLIADPPFWTEEFLDWGGTGWKRQRTTRPDSSRELWRHGSGEGVLWGGNLCTLNHLVGTRFLRPPEGPIVLFIEATDVEARLQVLRRGMVHLRDIGLMDRVSALLVGRSPDCVPEGDEGLREMILDVLGAFRFPVVGQMPFGHTDPMATLPIGCVSRVMADGSTALVEVVGPTTLRES